MNDDQTYNSIVFKEAYKSVGRSERRAAARGVNTPDVMNVATQSYVDPKNKVPGVRATVGVDYYELDATSVVVKSSAYAVFAVPSTSSSTAMTSQLATFRAIVAASGILEAVIAGEK